ncbi:MAG: bis-aminopropyl spermidine synthase family protein [Candidatus Njordarchaeia archaeon]
MFGDVVKKVENRTGIKTDEGAIFNILIAVRETNDFWKIVRTSEETYNVVAATLEELRQGGYIEYADGKVLLTDKGKSVLEKQGFGKGRYTCEKCKGKTVRWDVLSIKDEFMSIAKERPKAIINYDQGYVTPETTLARIAFMDQRGDLRGKNLLILGDDDLVSIAAMLTGFPKKITIFEIDKRLVEFIEKIGRRYNYDIEVRQHDLRKPLPEEFRGKYDTFFTDPTETLIGLKAFIGRGISALRGERCAGYFGLTRVESSLYKWRELQGSLISEFGVVITDIIKDFNEYVNWDYIEEMSGWEKNPLKTKPRSIWYTSSLFRIETLRGFKGFEETLEGDIYHDEETASV